MKQCRRAVHTRSARYLSFTYGLTRRCNVKPGLNDYNRKRRAVFSQKRQDRRVLHQATDRGAKLGKKFSSIVFWNNGRNDWVVELVDPKRPVFW